MGISIEIKKTVICESCRQEIYGFGEGFLKVFAQDNAISFLFLTTEQLDEAINDIKNHYHLRKQKVIHPRFSCIQEFLRSQSLKIHD